MSFDLSGILSGWPFESGELNARRISGEDGREKIQLRLDLGILQMETTGRPDGQKPHGHESLLDYYEYLLRKHIGRHGCDDGFELDAKACELLRSESVMYYHRYLATFMLGDYSSVQRDAKRNLRMFDFFSTYAEDEYDQYICEHYRPYVLMMYARARSRTALKQNRPKLALRVIEETIRQIQTVYDRFSPDETAAEASTELAVLEALADKISKLTLLSPQDRLRKKLHQAIAEERYEDAAVIRDRLVRPGRADAKGPAAK